MFNDRLSDYIEGVAARYLSPVDVDQLASHQHELGGLTKVFIDHLGRPEKGKKVTLRARMAYFGSNDSELVSVSDIVTWYDVRHGDRRPEYRLYYKTNAVTKLLKPGNFLLIAKLRDNSLLLLFCPADTALENQLRSLFGLLEIDGRFRAGYVAKSTLILPIRMLLEETGLIPIGNDFVPELILDGLTKAFGKGKFPTTMQMSEFARNALSNQFDPISAPDDTLMAWMEHEEMLFRALEKQEIQKRLLEGFGDDADEFVKYSLSIQNRRKARVGHAFENHLEEIFKAHHLAFERGKGKDRVTENKSQPDFLFPSFSSYRNENFPSEKLIILGAKTTCKDRWRQVLSEGERVRRKHLITTEVGISKAQIEEMNSKNLQLILPKKVRATYEGTHIGNILSLSEFIAEVKTLSKLEA